MDATLIVGVLVLVGCGKPMANLDGSVPSDGVKGDGAPTDVSTHTPGMPGLGAHAMSFYHLGASQASSIATSAIGTQTSGSTIVVSVGRGQLDAFAMPSALPTDSKGNAPYQQLGQTRKYTNWPSGTALYTFPSAHGGANHTITTGTATGDEITLAAVEVVEGTRINDFQWNEVLAPDTLTSLDVKTTGPATLIAFWWGDGFPRTPQSASPNNGFKLVDTNASELDSFVQCAVAFKNVTAAGTYNVTWTAMPEQGAQMWLVAVQ